MFPTLSPKSSCKVCLQQYWEGVHRDYDHSPLSYIHLRCGSISRAGFEHHHWGSEARNPLQAWGTKMHQQSVYFVNWIVSRSPGSQRDLWDRSTIPRTHTRVLESIPEIDPKIDSEINPEIDSEINPEIDPEIDLSNDIENAPRIVLLRNRSLEQSQLQEDQAPRTFSNMF